MSAQPEKRPPGRPREYNIRITKRRNRKSGAERIPKYRLEDLPDFLTVEEVADQWRCSTRAVYAAIERGELPALRVGGSFRIPKAEIGVRKGGIHER